MNEIPDDIQKAASTVCFLLGRPDRQEVDTTIVARALLAEREANAARIGKIEALCTRHAEARSALSTDLLSALDQLTAFALRVDAGEEEEIINTGNLYQITGAGAKNEVLKRKPAPPPAAVYADARWAGSRSPQFQARKEEYLAEFGPVYARAIALRLFGRRASDFTGGTDV